MKRIICWLLIFACLLPASQTVYVRADSTQEAEVWEQSDYFAEDKIIVLLHNKESLKFNKYSPADFTEADIACVEDLMEYTGGEVSKKLTAIRELAQRDLAINEKILEDYIPLNPSDYTQILCLTLNESGKDNVLKAVKALKNREDIMSVSPDYYIPVGMSSTPDPYIGEQWAINSIDLPAAWAELNTTEVVTVGVLDSGVDGTHPDLSSRMDRQNCQDFRSASNGTHVNPVVDTGFHGTGVAGVIAAAVSNGVGISGVYQNVKIASLCVGDGMFWSQTAVAAAINYAQRKGIKILNLSGEINSLHTGVLGAIKNYTGLFISGAGNSSRNLDTSDSYADYPEKDNHIIVGSYNQAETRAAHSNYGKTIVDIFAPGENILTCYPFRLCELGVCDSYYSTHYANGYHYISGTSFAAPYVAGVAALLLASNPSLTADQLKERICTTGKIIPDDNGENYYKNLCVYGKILNAHRALTHTAHSFTVTNINHTTYHERKCGVCDYAVNENHTFVFTAIISGGATSTHRAACNCGYTYTAAHRWSSDSIGAFCLDCLVRWGASLNSLRKQVLQQ